LLHLLLLCHMLLLLCHMLLLLLLLLLHLMQIAEWFAARALRLDSASGQLTSAQQLLELAVAKGYANFTVALSVNSAVNFSADRSSSLGAEASYLLRAGSSNSADGGTTGHMAAAAAAAAAQNGVTLPVQSLLVQTQVLLQLVKAWWPGEQQQQQRQQQMQLSRDSFTAEQLGNAAAGATFGGLPAVWAVGLGQWLSVGLLPQLLCCLAAGSSSAAELADR
jgi:hypothetical protein